MQGRGHRAVRTNAKHLPDDDAPLEMIRLLPLDASHDKILPNKNATPVAGEKSLAAMGKDLETRRFNALVC